MKKKEPIVLVNGYEVQDILSHYADEIGNELLYEIVVRMKTNCKVYKEHKQGEWIFKEYAWYNPTYGDIVCSECNCVYFEGVPESRIKGKLYNFCPNCGASMRKEGDGE